MSEAAMAGDSRVEAVDVAANLSVDVFDDDRDAVVTRALDAGVTGFVVAASSIEDYRKSSEIVGELRAMRAVSLAATTVGIHPWVAHEHAETTQLAGELRAALAGDTGDTIAAIGECGLDYCAGCPAPHDVQQRVFRAHLEVAAEVATVPLYLHCRDAHGDFTAMLTETAGLDLAATGGVVHCFDGDLEDALTYVRMGMHIGISGTVVGKSKTARRLRRILPEAVPLDRLLIETDAPYLLPRPRKSKREGMPAVPECVVAAKRNEPCVLPLIAHVLADVYGVSPSDLIAQTTANALHLFSSGPLQA